VWSFSRRGANLSTSERLRYKVELALPAYGAPLDLLLRDANARELYPRCLVVSYHVSRSMVPLMEAALERAHERASGDRVAAGVAAYLERHIPEEMHSDVPGDAVVDDLASLGLDAVEMRALPTTPQIAELVTEQFQWIENHPVAILGFLELEAHQADRATVERLIKITGLPREAFGQLLLHARLDLVHAGELHRVLDSLALEPWHEQMIGLSALRSMFHVTAAYLDVIAVSARPGVNDGPIHRRA
jgi:hypothetical protein